ncbi:MAG: polyphenol oxidase family protein, partial [Gemmatimonadales bacterium]
GGRGRRAADRTGGRRQSDGGDVGGEWRVVEGVDGHVAGGAGMMLCVTVADCTPIYLLHPATKSVALLHAGWRGAAAGILERGVQSLLVAAQGIPEESGADGVVCHLGVSICGDCYEVGPEVFQALGRFASSQQPEAPNGKGPLDVRRVLAEQAKSLGIGEVTVSEHCSRHGEGWYSHRGGDTGRMVGYLGVPA